MKAELAGVAAFGLALWCFGQEFKSAEVTAKIEQAVYERKSDVTPQERIALTHPLDCDATMCARQSSRQGCLTRARCYFRSQQ